MKKPKKHGLDIFRTLEAIDNRDMGFFDNLLPEEKKSLHSPVVMRWLSSTVGNTDEWYLCAVNERVNQHLYDLYDHPGLTYRLMASCGVGKQRHQWISVTPQSPRGKKEFVQKHYPDANELEISIILQHLSEPDKLDEFLTGSGIQNEEIKRIKKLFA